jgi:murein L,D-transpeptidase YcbB/YkuD
MPAIARSVCLLACCFALSQLRADSSSDVIDLIGSMTAALTEVDVPEFMDAFDPNMPGYDDLKNQVTALVNQAEVTSSVEPVQEGGDDDKRIIDLDWFLQVRSLLNDGPIIQRREVVHCELRKEKKKWKIVSLKPLDFFAPAKLDK